jgi:hypothetical protein
MVPLAGCGIRVLATGPLFGESLPPISNLGRIVKWLTPSRV